MHPLDNILKKYNIQSRYELSKLTGIPQTTLAHIASKNVEALSARNIIKIAKAIGVTPGQLLDELIELEKATQ